MLSKHERYFGLDMDALVSGCSRKTHVNFHGLDMDALVSGCSRNTHANYEGSGMDALETRTLLWFGHGCSGERMLSKNAR